jgi:hypothetical protein
VVRIHRKSWNPEMRQISRSAPSRSRRSSTYELGSALWKQRRPTEAAAALAEAWDLIQTDRIAGEWRRAPYWTAITYVEVAGEA